MFFKASIVAVFTAVAAKGAFAQESAQTTLDKKCSEICEKTNCKNSFGIVDNNAGDQCVLVRKSVDEAFFVVPASESETPKKAFANSFCEAQCNALGCVKSVCTKEQDGTCVGIYLADEGHVCLGSAENCKDKKPLPCDYGTKKVAAKASKKESEEKVTPRKRQQKKRAAVAAPRYETEYRPRKRHHQQKRRASPWQDSEVDYIYLPVELVEEDKKVAADAKKPESPAAAPAASPAAPEGVDPTLYEQGNFLDKLFRTFIQEFKEDKNVKLYKKLDLQTEYGDYNNARAPGRQRLMLRGNQVSTYFSTKENEICVRGCCDGDDICLDNSNYDNYKHENWLQTFKPVLDKINANRAKEFQDFLDKEGGYRLFPDTFNPYRPAQPEPAVEDPHVPSPPLPEEPTPEQLAKQRRMVETFRENFQDYFKDCAPFGEGFDYSTFFQANHNQIETYFKDHKDQQAAWGEFQNQFDGLPTFQF